MRIFFMGTPDFADASLKKLIESRHEVIGVACQPDKPKGRGKQLASPDTKVTATEHSIPVFQPKTLKNGELKETLNELAPDIIVVVAYGKLLPDYVIDFPKYGCVNVHGSLLPKYRGAAPIQRAVLDGEKYTGITTMKMDYGLDTGDMYDTVRVEIGDNETSAELFDRLSSIGAELLIETLDKIEAGTATLTKQDESKQTYAKMISKDEAKIDWAKTSLEIHNLVRGMNSWPMAYTLLGGEMIKIIRTEISDGKGSPGEVLGVIKGKGIKIATGDGAVCVCEVQAPGKRKVDGVSFLNGRKFSEFEN